MINTILDHLTPSDLQGAWRDLHGDPVPDPRTPGAFYDHLDEVTTQLQALRNGINDLKLLLESGKLSGNDSVIVESLISRASRTMDYVEKVLARDEWFPDTQIPVDWAVR